MALLGLLGLRIFEATGANIADLGEEHGHRVLRVCGKGTKVVLVPLPPAVGRAIDQAIGARARGPILLSSRGGRRDRHAATRRLRRLAEIAGVRITRPHPHMLRHTFVTTMPDAGVDLRDVQIAARHADPRTTMRCDRAHRDLGRVDFLVGLLAEHAKDLSEPYARHLGGKVRELRFHLLRQQTGVTYWLAPGRRVILSTVFPKTRSAGTAEVARALHAQKICEAEHGSAHQVFDREVN